MSPQVTLHIPPWQLTGIQSLNKHIAEGKMAALHVPQVTLHILPWQLTGIQSLNKHRAEGKMAALCPPGNHSYSTVAANWYTILISI